jgi:hypothetical protein
MNISSMAVSKAILLAMTFSVPFVANAQTYSGPECLGPYCVGHPVSAKSLLKQIEAPGEKISFWMLLAVYKSRDGRTCLDLRENSESPDDITYILLRDTSRCPGRSTSDDLRAWKTQEGVGLGGFEKDVLGTFGKPTSEENGKSEHHGLCAETRVISYSGKLGGSVRTTKFGIHNGKVSCISMSNLEYSGPQCLGPLCKGSSQRSASLLRQLGLPDGRKPIEGNYCFQSEDRRTFASVWSGRNYEWPPEEVEVVLSDFRNCVHMPEIVTKEDLQAWRTPEGFGLGSSEEEVLKAYGKPPREWKIDEKLAREKIRGLRNGDKLPDVGDKLFLYYGNEFYSTTEFGIRAGKVSYISFYDRDWAP